MFAGMGIAGALIVGDGWERDDPPGDEGERWRESGMVLSVQSCSSHIIVAPKDP